MKATETTQQIEVITADAQKTMEEGVEKVTKGMEEATAFGQETMEAVVASSKIAAKAAESLGAEFVAFSKKSYEDSMAAAKELTACKSVTEYFEKHTAFAKSSMEGFVAQTSKFNEMYATAAKEMMEPLAARFTAAVEMAKSPRV